MKKKIFALLTALCMTAAVLPAVFADGEEGDLTIGSTQEQCSCVTLCAESNINPDCPVCSAEGAELDKVCVGVAPMLPVTALAAAPNGQVIYVGNENVTNGGYWTTSEDGKTLTSVTSVTESNNYIHYDTDTNTLTLHNATIKVSVSTGTSTYVAGAAIGVHNQNGAAELTITLEGTNTIANVGKGIFVLASSASTGSSNLTIQGDGSLNASASQTDIWVQSNSNNAALCVENAEVTASADGAFKNGVLVQAKDGSDVSLTVNGGSLTASVNANIWFQFGSGTSGSGTPTVTVSNNAIVRANGGIANNSSSPIQYETGSDSTGGIVFDGNTGTVYGSVTLQDDLTIGAGETLTVPNGSSLNGNGKLTNNGTIIVEKGGNLTGNPGGKVVYAPAITNHPQDVEVKENETANFTVEAAGGNLSYQWQQSTDNGSSWTVIADATDATYTTPATTMDMSGTQYRCVVSNSAGSVISDAATLTVQQAGVPIPPQPTDPTTPETTAPTDTDHTVQTDNSGHAPVEDNTALPSFWELVTERINATPRGGEITINMGARAVPDSVLNALRARKLTATFRYGDTELTLTPDQLPPEGTLTEWTLRELGNYVTESDESIRISEEKSEAENAAAAETTAPAADTGKPNPATGETTTTAVTLLVAAAALTGLGVTIRKK